MDFDDNIFLNFPENGLEDWRVSPLKTNGFRFYKMCNLFFCTTIPYSKEQKAGFLAVEIGQEHIL